jgi:outer membrane lipoprotein-sorting protein
MDTTALLLSAALALFSGAQDADPQSGPDAALPAGQVEDADPAADAPAADAEAPPPEQTLSDADYEAMRAEAVARETARAQAWFDALDTLRADFLQFSPDGSQTSGVLSLDRPGRARFDYDDPSPILLVADGSTVAVADFELETLDRVPLGATPLAPLLDADETLAERGAVADAGRADGRLYLTLVDPEGETDGRLTLIFDDPDPDRVASEMTLAGWYAVDALDGLTEVRLSNVETGVEFNPRIFILDDEDVFGDDRRRGRR